MPDTVAAIIPAYNAAQHVRRTIESVMAQTVPLAEIIVVDDGSSDDTADIVRSFPPPVRLIQKPNGGPASARNLGARATTATWLAFIDADDKWLPTKIAAQLAVVQRAEPSDIALVHCLPDHRDEAVPDELTFDHLWDRNWIINSSVLMRRDVFEEIGGFDEARDLISVEDYNLWLRIAASRWRIVTCQQVLVQYTRGIGLSSHTARFLDAQIRNIQRIGALLHLPPSQVRRKQGLLLADFGRRSVFERDFAAARRSFVRSLMLRPAPGTAAHLIASFAPRQAYEARRQIVARLSAVPVSPTGMTPPRVVRTRDGAVELALRGDEALIIRRPSGEPAMGQTTMGQTPMGPGPGRPVVITTVDAEEDFDWHSPFSRNATDVTSMRSQQIAHRVFEKYGVKPSYMVDFPVASQDAGRGPLRELLRQGLCDVGSQLHPWVTPPFDEAVSFHNSYAGNLPLQMEYDKIAALTDEIDRAFGTTPRVFRAGRYGVGPNTGGILRQLGYQADSSIVPCWSFTDQGGPDYRLMTARPFWIDRERTLLELPVSAAVVGAASGLPATITSRLFRRSSERARLPSVMARLGLLERIKLTPEGIAIEEAKRLVRHMVADGIRVFVLTYHSPSLEPGNTPYVRSHDDLDRFLGWLDEFYDFFRSEIGGAPASWNEVRASFLPPRTGRAGAVAGH